MPELYDPRAKAPEKLLHRRTLLRYIAGLGAYALMPGVRSSADLPLSNLDKITLLTPPPKGEAVYHGAEQLDFAYVNQLLESLQEEKGTPRSRLRATRAALRRIEIHTDTGKSIGTALQLDESGIYLTAKHVVGAPEDVNRRSSNPVALIHPSSGEAMYAVDFALHPHADIALVSAPTGRERRPIEGIRLSFQVPPDDARLVMTGFFLGDNANLFNITEEGRVDSEIKFPPLTGRSGETFAEVKASLAVTALIPRGGSSGSPILDDSGRIVGVESGYYPVADRVADYEGARITPLHYLTTIPL